MGNQFGNVGSIGLKDLGLETSGNEYWNLSAAELVERTVREGSADLASRGQLVVETGEHTGRSAGDKFLVRDPEFESELWWGDVNKGLTPDQFKRLESDVLAHLNGEDIYILDAAGGADPAYRLPIRVVAERPWHNLFGQNLFLRLSQEEQKSNNPVFTILHAPSMKADPKRHGTASGAFIVVSFSKNLALIGGTSYAGEIKKTIFTVLNFLLPRKGVMAMHCSANVGDDGDVALFFGLSGTGKTTLSSVPDRSLIGDDEHGWGDKGVFNFEGGCYAKMINLSQEYEPIIWVATDKFGTILENVVLNPATRNPDFDDNSLTENTRGAYPIDHVSNYVPSGMGGQPNNVFFLTADAFGVIPPIARLSPDQTMYYFLSGYTSKLAGTEKGLGNEPQATFSSCFGAPFLPLPPNVYADLLGEKVVRHNTNVWLVNTGWTGGPYGSGERISLPLTRAMVNSALDGSLANVETRIDPFFNLNIPVSCEGVPGEVLNPREIWKDKDAYDQQAKALAARFHENFEQYRESVTADVAAAGPAS